MGNFAINIKAIREKWELSQDDFGLLISATRGMVMQYEKRGSMPKSNVINKLEEYTGFNFETLDKSIIPIKKLPEVNSAILEIIEKLKKETNETNSQFIKKDNNVSGDEQTKLIPFYDIVTIGGMNKVANMESNTEPSEWINAGDWFKEATAAIRHYNDSMKEYPSGCILALKQIFDIELIIWGWNYVIETDEYRITKKAGKGKEGFIVGHSTNDDKYPDGTLIHQPVDIPLSKIRRISLVIGKVEKEHSSMVVNIK